MDGQTAEAAEAKARALIARLRRDLLEGCSRPGDVRRVWVPKPGGGGQRGLREGRKAHRQTRNKKLDGSHAAGQPLGTLSVLENDERRAAPSSRRRRLNVEAHCAAINRPISVEPVKLIALSRTSLHRIPTIVAASPVTNAPAGWPARSRVRAASLSLENSALGGGRQVPFCQRNPITDAIGY